MKIKNLYFIISFFAINFTRAQPFGESNLPFENNEITIEKVMAGIFALAVYFIPTIISRDKKKWRYIFLFNLLTSWTIIGWFISLVWALNAKSKIIKNVETESEEIM